MAIFKCGLHNFTTDNIEKWDKHCSSKSHEYNLRILCANSCGKTIHIKPTQKVSNSNRVPRGYLCNDCKKKVQNVPEIKEAGEV